MTGEASFFTGFCTKDGQLQIEAFPTTTTGLGVGVLKLEATPNQLFGKIQCGSSKVESRLGINEGTNPGAIHEDVTLLSLGNKLQFVTETVTATARDTDAQESSHIFTTDQLVKLTTSRLGKADKAFITYANAIRKSFRLNFFARH